MPTPTSVLASYNPIKSISLPGVELLDPEGLIVIVGPNSSGKTLFLNDIERFLLTGKSDHIVCKAIIPRKPEKPSELINEMIEKRYLRPVHDQLSQYNVMIPFFGSVRRKTSQPRIRVSFDQVVNTAARMDTDPQSIPAFFEAVGQVFVAPLTLEDRRKVSEKANAFDHLRETADFPLQGLLINSDAMSRLEKETSEVFGNAVWMDTSSEKGAIQLRVSGSPAPPPRSKMQNPFEASEYRSISTEGDGYRSFVGVCMSLLMGMRAVALIDEPELCLHPPQAYRMGRFIGQHASPENHVAFVATHSSHVLRGILDAGSHAKTTVIRLRRKQDSFWGRKIADTELIDCVRSPRTRAEAILDGLFAQSVVLVESDGDREVYQAASEVVKDYAAREVQFIPVGGTGGFAEPCRFYRHLEIPVAVIADLDAVADTTKMIPCAEALCTGAVILASIKKSFRNIASKLKEQPPTITEDEVRNALRELSVSVFHWKNGDDNSIRRALNELEGKIKRIQRLKDGGLEAYSDCPEVKQELESLVEQCKSFGLFFVPRGELENWVPHLMADSPKRMNKTERAAMAAKTIRAATEKEGDVWEFVRSVFDYLKARLHT